MKIFKTCTFLDVRDASGSNGAIGEAPFQAVQPARRLFILITCCGRVKVEDIPLSQNKVNNNGYPAVEMPEHVAPPPNTVQIARPGRPRRVRPPRAGVQLPSSRRGGYGGFENSAHARAVHAYT